MTYNHALFREIRDIIALNPEKHDQSAWENGHGCDTTRCVAGWAVYLEGLKRGMNSDARLYEIAEVVYGDESYGPDYAKLGAELLGLNEDEASKLFLYVCDSQAEQIVDHLAVDGATFPWNLFD